MSSKKYKEKQTFSSNDLTVILSIILAFFMYAMVHEIIIQQPDMYITIPLTSIVTIAIGLSIYYLHQQKMKTTVGKKNISIRLKSLQTEKEKIRLDEIENCTIVKTPKAAQWLGANISFCNEKYYSISGRNGVAITTKEGDQYFIGSQKAEELGSAIKRAISS